MDHGRNVLVLCRRRAHFATLRWMLDKAGISHAAIFGSHSVRDRTEAKRQLSEGNVKVLLASEILAEGEDLPGLGAIVLAEGIKSTVNSRQRVGRGMELTANGDVWVVDIIPSRCAMLVQHGLERVQAWEQCGYEVKVVEKWNENGNYDRLLPFLDWVGDPVLV